MHRMIIVMVSTSLRSSTGALLYSVVSLSGHIRSQRRSWNIIIIIIIIVIIIIMIIIIVVVVIIIVVCIVIIIIMLNA